MMQPEAYELIERYLLGKLNRAELQVFEQRLAREPAFAEEVALQRQVFEALRMEAKSVSFRAKLAEVEKKLAAGTQATAQNPKFRWPWVLITIGLLSLVLLGWWIWFKNADPVPAMPQALFAAYFSPPANISTAAKRDADTTATMQQSEADQQWNVFWEKMESQYAQEDFAGALATLQQIQALDPTGEYASETFYYTGLLHLKMGKAQLALEAFEKVSVGHVEDKTWYSALALLALNRTDDAQKLLKMIVAENYAQKPAALKILAKI